MFEVSELKFPLRDVVAFEIDSDFDGCADAFTESGLVLAIQPADFTI